MVLAILTGRSRTSVVNSCRFILLRPVSSEWVLDRQMNLWAAGRPPVRGMAMRPRGVDPDENHRRRAAGNRPVLSGRSLGPGPVARAVSGLSDAGGPAID